MSFFEKYFVLKFLGQKGYKVGPNWAFSSYMKNQCIELFLFLNEFTAA